MRANRSLMRLLLVLTVIAALGACASQSPIPVYITPTPASLPTSEAQATAKQVQSAFGSASDPQDALVSLQASDPLSQAADRPTVTWQGPVIGPGYQLPPTFPPAATSVVQPTPGAVSTLAPQEGAAATVTAPGTPLFPDVLPNLDPGKLGVQIEINLDQGDWDNAMYRMNTDLPLGWVKFQLPWKDVQPNAAGELSDFWRRTRLYLEDADRRGFRILLSVAKAPQWARPGQNGDGPPDDPQTYASFLTQLLGEVGGTIDAIEIWNEPNLSREWTGSLPFNGTGYMRLFDAGYRAIRAYSPSIAIVTAGLAPTGENPGSRDDRTFLREMYAAGLGNYRDIALGIHPYSWANPPDATCCGTSGWDDDPHFFFSDNLRDYREIMVASGHGDMQMWITEFGYATWDGFPGTPAGDGNQWILRNDKWDQGNYTISAINLAQQQSFIGPMFIWNLNFATLAGLIQNGDERAAYSLVLPGESGHVEVGSSSRTERPLYWMLYDAIRPDVNLDKYD